MEKLIAYKEVVKKEGQDLSDIFYTREFVRLWQYARNSFCVDINRSGEGIPHTHAAFLTFNEAMGFFNEVTK